MKNKVLSIVGIPLITFLLFVFECSDPEYYLAELIWSFFISLTLWQGNGLLIKGLDRYIPWRNPAAPRVFLQIGISVLFTLWITYFAVKYLYSGVYEAHFSSLIFRQNFFIFLLISLLYNAIYTGSHFFRQWRKSIVEAEELKRQNLVSQYESLKNQVNPHFFFNSVNTLIGLIDEDPDLAKKYGHQFAEIYRSILTSEKKELITLKEELRIVELQKQLLQSRFGEALRFSFVIPSTLDEKMIPPLTLQMLVENAIKHNAISKKIPLHIEIKAYGGRLTVSNNIIPKNIKSESTQIGLDNIKSRYKFFSSEKVRVEKDDKSFVVSLPLLDKTSNEHSNS